MFEGSCLVIYYLLKLIVKMLLLRGELAVIYVLAVIKFLSHYQAVP